MEQKRIPRLSWRCLFISALAALFLFLILSVDLRISVSDSGTQWFGAFLSAFHTYGLPANIFTVALSVGLYFWFRFFGYRVFRYSKSLTGIALVFGMLNTAALYLFHRDALPSSPLSVCFFVFQAVGYAFLFLIVSRVILHLFVFLSSSTTAPSSNRFITGFSNHPFLFSFLLILLCWSVWIVSYYPASMEWDVYNPIRQFLGELPANNHHPWFYACTVGSAYALGLRLGDKNIGIFIYILIRAVIMAAIYARCVSLQKRACLPWVVWLGTSFFFAFTPVWGAYAKHAFKDSFGAAFFCWYILSAVSMLRQLDSGTVCLSSCAEHALAGLLACLFRNNTQYAVIPTTLLLVVAWLWKYSKKRFFSFAVAVVLLSGLFAYKGYQYYIFTFCGVDPGSSREALSIPFQQTARTVKYHSEEITENELLAINSSLQYYTLSDSYDPIISDPVKDRWHGTPAAHRWYLATWAKMSLKYPLTYIEAFIAHSSGYYAFTPEYTEQQRYGPGPHGGVGMTIFNWVEDSRFDPDFTCRYLNGFSVLREILDNLAKVWHQTPILNWTDMKPSYTWTIVLMFWFFLKRREFLKLLPLFACLLMILTCIAAPINDCFRYYSPVAAAFPVLWLLFVPAEREQQREPS